MNNNMVYRFYIILCNASLVVTLISLVIAVIALALLRDPIYCYYIAIWLTLLIAIVYMRKSAGTTRRHARRRASFLIHEPYT